MSGADVLENLAMPDNADRTQIKVKCRHCENTFLMEKWVLAMAPPIGGENTTACQDCIEKYITEKWKERIKAAWINRVPKRYRETDKTSPKWPKHLWNNLRARPPGESMIIYGPDEMGKTRLMIEWVKLTVWKKRWSFDFLMTDELDGFLDDREGEARLRQYGTIQCLGISNLFDELKGDKRGTKWMKRLLAMRKRNELCTIATSSLGSSVFVSEGSDYWETDRVKVAKVVDEWIQEDWTSEIPGQMDLEDDDDPF